MELVDLSMSISETMPVNRPDHFPPSLREYSTLSTNGWVGTRITVDSHCGTHIDAPSHFVPHGETVENLSLAALCGRACRIPVSVDGVISARACEEVHGRRVLFYSGASDWADTHPSWYFTQYPYLSVEAAREIVKLGLSLVGVDTPSVDPPGESEVHKILLGNNVYIVENLANLGACTTAPSINVVPLRIRGCDGSPVRAVAYI